jgi:hypothetical protein
MKLLKLRRLRKGPTELKLRLLRTGYCLTGTGVSEFREGTLSTEEPDT